MLASVLILVFPLKNVEKKKNNIKQSRHSPLELVFALRFTRVSVGVVPFLPAGTHCDSHL